MERVGFILLIACALLATTFPQPGTRTPSSSVRATPAAADATLASVPIAATEATEPESVVQTEAVLAQLDAEAQTVLDDARVAELILGRLNARHTALPQREREALAHTIVREARRNGLDPDLVVAVIEVESGGYHLATSTVGALGLMQLMPGTGEELAGELGIEWLGPDTLFDPTVNVRLGTAYLRELTDRFGKIDIALAAYNWGPGRIHRRLRRGASVPSRYIEQVRAAYDRNAVWLSQRS